MGAKINSLVPELSVSSFETSLNFYVQVLGFSVAYQREEEGFAFLTLGEAQIMIDEIGKGRTWETGEFEYPLGRGINFQIEVDDIQPILDRYLSGAISEAAFLKASRPWPNYAADYRPVVEFAREHHWRVIAANVPRPIGRSWSGWDRRPTEPRRR